MIAEDVALDTLVHDAVGIGIVDIDKPIGMALVVADDFGRDAEAAWLGVVEYLAQVGPADEPVDDDIDERADPCQHHGDNGFNEIQDD